MPIWVGVVIFFLFVAVVLSGIERPKHELTEQQERVGCWQRGARMLASGSVLLPFCLPIPGLENDARFFLTLCVIVCAYLFVGITSLRFGVAPGRRWKSQFTGPMAKAAGVFYLVYIVVFVFVFLMVFDQFF